MPRVEEVQLYREAKQKFPNDPVQQHKYVYGTMENQEHKHTCVDCRHPDHKK